MNATKRSVARVGLVVCGALAIALTGCRTNIIHEHTRTVYVPAPPPVVHPPPVVVVPPAPAPQPPPVVVVPPPEQPPVVVIQAESDFYEPLGAHGRWVVVGSYGRCWIPARVEAGWRPYSNGYWQRTDAGWYWMSDEPWGWATYHYGRWDWRADFGWFWVPQTQWAPAWVAWREGGGYVGWAPLRPSITMGVSIGAVNYEPAFASRAFVFVEHRRMLGPVRPKTVIVNNTTIINQTVNITNVKVVNKTVINEGPRPEVIERESGRKVQAVPAHEFRRREESPVAARQRNIPAAPERKVQPPARTEPQPPPKQAVLPSDAHVAEKSAAVLTQPGRPLAAPARPTPPPSVQPQPKPEVKPAPTVPPRRDVRPVEQPAPVVKPAPQPVTPNPIRRDPAVENRNTAAPPAVQPKPGNEVRPATDRAPRPPVRVETAPPASVRQQPAPAAERPAEKKLMSPKEKSGAAERDQASEMKKEDKGAKKKGKVQVTPLPEVPTRQPR